MSNIMNVDGVEVYAHEIYRLADEFVYMELNDDESLVHDNFLCMVFYIADRIKKPDNDDIKLLDGIFDVFVRLCVKYKVLPTLESFGFLVTIDRRTFSAWERGQYRKGSEHGDTVKRWFDICKSFVVEKLHNTGGASVNLIFTAKSAYQIREASPIPAEGLLDNTPQLSREAIASRYAAFKEIPEKLELE